MKYGGLGAGVLLLTALAMPAGAQSTLGGNTLNLDWDNKPVIRSAGGKLVIKLKGRVFLDHAWVNDRDNTINLNASEFRTARVGVDGGYGKKIAFRFTADFARKKVTYKDIYIAWKGPIEIKAGHFKLPPSFDEATSSRFTDVMERSGYSDAFAFGRQFGIALTRASDKGLFAVGVFQGGFAGSGDHTGFKFTARATRAIPAGEATVHLGAGFRYRETGDNEGNFQYRERAFQHLAPRFINTSRIADADTFFGFEAGVFRGPFSLYGELGFMKAQLAAPAVGQKDPSFWGGYINAGYFLFGGSPTYSAKKGALDRPKVTTSVLKGGRGALQLVVRYDHIDLVDAGIFGGIQKTFIIGANWWLSRHIKVAVNYSHSNIAQALLVAANGADGANAVNAFGFRTQIDW